MESIYIISSLARGDYRPGLSDQDLLIFFSDNVDRPEQQSVVKDLESHITDHEPEFKNLDILYLNHQELPLTFKQQLASPVSKFSLFGFDLKDNHLLIHGLDILAKFQPLLDPVKYVDRYLDHYLQQAKEADSLDRLILTTGQIIRCLFIKEEVVTLEKERDRKINCVSHFSSKGLVIPLYCQTGLCQCLDSKSLITTKM